MASLLNIYFVFEKYISSVKSYFMYKISGGGYCVATTFYYTEKSFVDCFSFQVMLIVSLNYMNDDISNGFFVDHFGNAVTHNDVKHYAIIKRSIIFVAHSFFQSFFLLYPSNSVGKQVCWVFRNYYACMSVCVKPCPRPQFIVFDDCHKT